MGTRQKRLLHAGANTSDILTQYISTIKALHELDPSGTTLGKSKHACMHAHARVRVRAHTHELDPSGTILGQCCAHLTLAGHQCRSTHACTQPGLRANPWARLGSRHTSIIGVAGYGAPACDVSDIRGTRARDGRRHQLAGAALSARQVTWREGVMWLGSLALTPRTSVHHHSP